MLATDDGTLTTPSAVQPWNADRPMDVTPLPMVMSVSDVQPEKAASPICVTASGTTMVSSRVQFWNAEAGRSPMASGSSTLPLMARGAKTNASGLRR